MEGDGKLCQNCFLLHYISTHALTWRATCIFARLLHTLLFLPTPSHGGRRGRQWHNHYNDIISTHALTWRATYLRVPDIEGIGISTHALTWRATVLYFKMRHAATLISTHALTWRATCHRCARSPHSHISTHALTWRATCCDVGLSSKSLDFYPRPHMEGDGSKLKGLADEAGFLPTPSHGGRPEAAGGGRSNAAFLPTPSHGGRPGLNGRW